MELKEQKANLTTATRLENLLKQMYEYYIVVGDFTNGNKYHMTKGYGTIKVETDANNQVTHIIGGSEAQKGTKMPVGHTYPQKNGNTYRLDEGMIQPPTQSVYKVLSTTEEFAEFYNLCMGSDYVLDVIGPRDRQGVVIQDSIKRYKIFENLGGLDLNVRTFNTYHYTVYTPTNDDIQRAYDAGLPNWVDMEVEAELIDTMKVRRDDKQAVLDDLRFTATQEEIDAMQTEIDAMQAEINTRIAVLKKDMELVVNFVKYHIQDNSVYVDNLPHSITEGAEVKYVVKYETAALDNLTKRFSTVTVQTQDGTITVKGDIEGTDNTCRVINEAGTEGTLYNIMTRDIEFSGQNISTSSYAVVHLIDGFLVNDRIFDAAKGTFIK